MPLSPSKSRFSTNSVAFILFCIILAGLFFAGDRIFPSTVEKRITSNGNGLEKSDIASSIVKPHRALYDVTLVSKKSGAQIVDLRGQMFFELKHSCEAWISEHHFTLNYQFTDAAPFQIKSDFTTFENFDGKMLNFSTQRKRDEMIYEEFRGSAEKDPESGKGKASFKIPEGLEYELPFGSYFPVGHTIKVLEEAAAGKKFFVAPIFDGSDGEGPFEVSAFISPQVKTDYGFNTTIINQVAWPIRMAFFSLKNREETAEYEMDIMLHDNGIISNMVIEYEDFAVRQKLVALEELPYAECD